MPLASGVAAELTRLGAVLPALAESLPVRDVLSQVRWADKPLECRLGIAHWFEPRRLSFFALRPFKDPVRGADTGALFLQLGSTDHEFLLVRGDDLERDASDPGIVVFDPEAEDPPLALPFSTLLSNLQIKKPTAKALEKLVKGIDTSNTALVKEALAEGADVNATLRRDIELSPLALAMRNIARADAASNVVALLKAGADPNHPIVIAEILGGMYLHTAGYHTAIESVFAHGGRVPPKHDFAVNPVRDASPKSLELLLDNGLDVNAVVANGYLDPPAVVSALCEAAWRGGYANAEVLVRRGADVNYVAAPYGLTALHFAVLASEATDLVRLLIEHDARDRRSGPLPEGMLRYQGTPVSIDAPGLFARELAEKVGSPEIAALIPR